MDAMMPLAGWGVHDALERADEAILYGENQESGARSSSGGAEGAHPQRLAADDRRAGGGGIDAAPERWEAQKGSRAPEQWYWRW